MKLSRARTQTHPSLRVSFSWPSSLEAAVAISDAAARGYALNSEVDYQEFLKDLSEDERAAAEAREKAERPVQCQLLRDIVGNPFLMQESGKRTKRAP